MMKSRSTSRSMRSSDWPVCLDMSVVGDFANAKNLARMNVDIRGLAGEPAHRRLMDEDPRVGQGKAFARGAGKQQKRAHAGRLADAVRHDIVVDELHGVINREAGGDGAARRVDVELDVFFRVFAREKEHLRDDQVRDLIVDRRSKKDNVVAQQTGVNVVGAFAPARLLNHHRYKCHCSSFSPRSRYGSAG